MLEGAEPDHMDDIDDGEIASLAIDLAEIPPGWTPTIKVFDPSEEIIEEDLCGNQRHHKETRAIGFDTNKGEQDDFAYIEESARRFRHRRQVHTRGASHMHASEMPLKGRTHSHRAHLWGVDAQQTVDATDNDEVTEELARRIEDVGLVYGGEPLRRVMSHEADRPEFATFEEGTRVEDRQDAAPINDRFVPCEGDFLRYDIDVCGDEGPRRPQTSSR